MDAQLREKTAWSSREVSRAATLLISVGALIRVLSFFLSNNSGGDARERMTLTAGWLRNPVWKLSFDGYPPGHFWLMAAMSKASGNVEIGARLLSLVLGIASLYVVWRLTSAIFGNIAGLFSLAVYCFYTLHIGYSTTSSAEVSYAFFLLLGLYFFVSYYSYSPEIWRLVLSGLSLSVSESIRYEAWIVFFALGMISLWYVIRPDSGTVPNLMTRLRPILAFGVTAGAWPALMMLYGWRQFGDPFFQVTDTHRRVAILLSKQPSPFYYQISLIPVVLFLSLSPFAFMAAIYALRWCTSSRLRFAFGAVVVFFASVQLYEIARGEVVAVARYSISLGTLLAVLSGFGFERFSQRIWPNQMRRAFLIVVALVFINAGLVLAASEIPNPASDKFASISPKLRFPRRISDVGNYLRAHSSPNDKIVIDNYNYESDVLADAAGLPIFYRDRAYLASSRNDMTAAEYIAANHPRFLVYSDRGVFREWLQLSADCSQSAAVDGVQYRCVHANREYRVYELTYKNSDL